MPTNIFSIQPREVNFRLQTNTDWLDGLAVYQASQGGVQAGAGNAGNGSLVVAGVAPATALGAHIVAITSVGSQTQITVADPSGTITAHGVVGLATYADGIVFTVVPGTAAFAVGDTFAIGVLPQAVDLTGVNFDLQARLTQTTANVCLSATSHPADPADLPTIAVGTTGGQVAMRVLKEALSRDQFPPGTYVYDLVATADGLTVPAFYGTITHVDGVTFLAS